ncbi:MAG: MBL fold metallo-hydrolase [Deltaproteobacteria bacterium]|nr:MBL fold metallo-hydrolase [Deltaproteobacteria bacterium]
MERIPQAEIPAEPQAPSIPPGPALRSKTELLDALTRSRLEELDDLHALRRPARRTSLLASWIYGWLVQPRQVTSEPLPEVAPGEVGITFAGHASVLVRYSSLCIACDPMLADRIHVVRRSVSPGVGATEMIDVNLVLISHPHPGHLDLPTLRGLPRSATIVVPPRCASRVSSLGFARTVELGIGQSLQHRGVDIASVPVKHPVAGGGVACAYVIRGDGPSVFFCADSGYFSGFTDVGRRYQPDVAILPIGGYLPAGQRADHMSPLDALYAFEDLRARMMIPIHHGAFPLSYETLGDPTAWLAELTAERELEAHVTILLPGASRKFTWPVTAAKAAQEGPSEPEDAHAPARPQPAATP